MVKRRRFNGWLRFPQWPPMRLEGLSIYWQRGIWRDVLGHFGSLKMTTVAIEVVFLWVLGLMGGSFALLQGHRQDVGLPAISLYLSSLVQHMLVPLQPEPGTALGSVWVWGIAVLAWLCCVSGTARLCHLVGKVYRSSLPKRARWLTLALHWWLTLMIIAIANLVLSWVGPEALAPITADALRLKTAEGSAVAPSWQATLWQVVRWPAAVGLVGLGLGMIYRLSPKRWTRGAPLWPGVGVVLALGALGLGLGLWSITTINTRELAAGLLLVLAITLLVLLWLVLLIPLGAQFNVSLVNQGAAAVSTVAMPPMGAPPPSFDSFKINRSPGERWPRE